MFRRDTLLLILGCVGLVACQPGAPPQAPTEKKCSASKQSAANKKLTSAAEHYPRMREALDAKTVEDETAAVTGAARESYELCPSGAAAFYYGASLLQQASGQKQSDAYYHNIAKARCLLEEALDAGGDERITDEDIRRDARSLATQAIDRGAARLIVTAADGSVTVTSGDGEAKQEQEMAGGSVSLCLMPGPYDVSVHSDAAGDGTAVVTVRPGESHKQVFEPRSPKEKTEQAQRVMGWSGMLLLVVGQAFVLSTLGALGECSSAPSMGKKCTNEGYLSDVQATGWTFAVTGGITFFIGLAVAGIGDRALPKKHQAPVAPAAP